ncbi:MAG TPA: hypothetical protein RMH99_15435 [Sandaracinaceae bacterium LLY-WYZ-13_1]|nr:hypothetical protein [Sandaracinaceae bacterium LLY-WYZ-13_1]
MIVLGLGGLFLLIGCCGLFTWAGISSSEQQQEFSPLAAACDGRAVEGTATHPAPDTRAVVMERRSSGDWHFDTLLTPRAYQPETRAETSLVVCMEEPREVTIERCEFIESMWGVDVDDMSLPRTQQQAPARLVEAATGRVLVTGEIHGATPSCDDWSGDEPSESDFEGEDIEADDIHAWLVQQLPSG